MLAPFTLLLGMIADTPWYAPAYTEPMESILLLATDETSALPERFEYPNTPTAVQAELAKALHTHVHVRILVDPGSQQRKRFEAALVRAGMVLPMANVSFLNVSHCDIWARDTGPIWLRRKGGGGRLMIEPRFTLWGYLVGGHVQGPWASCDVPNRVPDQLSNLLGIQVEKAADFVTEGGDKSFNGRGTVLMSRAVERQRHPGLSDAEIEALARQYLRVHHIVWTDEGVADDEQSFRGALVGEGGKRVYTAIGTGGHVDECARFVGPSTVVVPELTAEQASRSPLARATSQRLEANAMALASQTDEEGRNLTVERMPYPEELYLQVNRSDGVFSLLSQLPELGLAPDSNRSIDIILAASYTNYVIANGLVVIPQYFKPGRDKRFADADARAVAAIKRLLPGHKVVGVNPEPVNAGGGGLNVRGSWRAGVPQCSPPQTRLHSSPLPCRLSSFPVAVHFEQYAGPLGARAPRRTCLYILCALYLSPSLCVAQALEFAAESTCTNAICTCTYNSPGKTSHRRQGRRSLA